MQYCLTGSLMLTLCSLLDPELSSGKISSPQIRDIFSYFFSENRFDISCELSPEETNHIECLALVSEKNRQTF